MAKPTKQWAVVESIKLLERVIENQPDLTNNIGHIGHGGAMAHYFIQFVEQYSEWLMQQDVWQD